MVNLKLPCPAEHLFWYLQRSHNYVSHEQSNKGWRGPLWQANFRSQSSHSMRDELAEKLIFSKMVGDLFFFSCHIASHMQWHVCCSCSVFMFTVWKMYPCNTLRTIALFHESINFLFTASLIADFNLHTIVSCNKSTLSLGFTEIQAELLPGEEQIYCPCLFFLYVPPPCANTVQVLVWSSISAIVVAAFQ